MILGLVCGVAPPPRHHGGLGAGVDVFGAFGAAVVSGGVIEIGHTEVDGEARLGAEALRGSELARQFGGAHQGASRGQSC